MNRSEVAQVLAAAAARDQRTIGEADVLAWHQDLSDVDYGSALLAVSEHYRTSERRLMPVHIRRIVAEFDAEHAAIANPNPLPAPRPGRRVRESTTRGLQIVGYVLRGLRAAGSDPANGVRLGPRRIGDLAETLAAQAVQRFRAEQPSPPVRTPCNRPGCECTHDADPFTGFRCDAGWLTHVGATIVQGTLDGDDEPASVDDRVRPCQVCDPERHRILNEHGGATPTSQRLLQARKGSKRKAGK